jgi:hypothetical protein
VLELAKIEIVRIIETIHLLFNLNSPLS